MLKYTYRYICVKCNYSPYNMFNKYGGVIIEVESVKRHKLLFLIAITVIVFVVSFLCLSNDIHIVYQYLFLIPMIIACFWYKKKGIIYSALVSMIHISMYSFFTNQNLVEEFAKLLAFIGLSVFIEMLVERLEQRSADIYKLNIQLQRYLKMMKKSEELSSMGSSRIDLKSSQIVWSDNLYKILGIDPEHAEPSVESRLKITYPNDLEMVKSTINNVMVNRQNAKIESRIIWPDGSVRWLRSIGYTEYGKTGKPEILICSFLDITEQKHLEQELYREKESFKITLSSIGDGVISTDTKGNVTLLNEQAERLTGWDHQDAVGKPFEEVFNIINEGTRKKCDSPIKRVIQSGIIIGLANHTVLVSRYGTEYSIADSAAPIKDTTGKISGVVIVFRNVTEEKMRQNQIQYISYHDALTGIYNRRYFEEQIKALDTEENLPLSIVMGDLNGLKVTNDAFGHSQGDRLLKKAAESMQEACRASDIVARWGGDEFVIILPKTSRTDAKEVIERIEKIESGMKVGLMHVSVSLGYSVKEAKDENILTVLKNAEDHMYEGKVAKSESTRGKIIDAAISALVKLDPTAESHLKEVGTLAQQIGEAMRLPQDDIINLEKIGQLHDIGKVAIDQAILLKQGPLTAIEIDEIQRHPDIGYKILKSSKETASLAEYVLDHHERYDGKGYPSGLKREEIPLLSRIITVADAFNAMVSDRSYRKAMSLKDAINELVANKGTQFDPEIVDVAVKMIKSTYSSKTFPHCT